MTNLSDFLKCEKVRCVEVGFNTGLTMHKEYEILEVTKDEVCILNDNGLNWRYQFRRFEPVIETAIQAVNTLVAICHGASKSAGWWTDLATGEPLKRNKGEMLMLMVSELAEAMEADRKSLNDDHLPQYDGVSVELADCMVRICDFVGGFDLKTAEAMADKIEYNANRADHKIENRLKDNGKKY